MKQTDQFAVLRSKESGAFLSDFKRKKGTFAYSASFTDDLRHAAKNEISAIEEQKEGFDKFAYGLGCEILVVEAEYTLKTLDGNEPEDLTKQIEKANEENAFKEFIKMLTRTSAED